MKIIKIILEILLIFTLVDVASAETHIPAGSVSSYNMNAANETYILDGDITATGSAINVGANGVTLNGNGHNITYADTAVGYGVICSTSKSNITIRNVNFVKGANTSTSSRAVSLYTVSTASLSNITGSLNYGSGAVLINTTDAIVTNCTLITATSSALSFTNANNITIDHCSLTSASAIALSFDTSSNATCNDIDTMSTFSRGLYCSNSNNMTFSECTSSSGSGFGISLSGSNYITFENCRSVSSSSNSISIVQSNNSVFNDCTGESNISAACFIDRSHVNRFTDGVYTSSTNRGVYLLNSTTNVFTRCVGESDSNNGIFLYGSSNDNTFIDCTGSSNTIHGVRFYTDVYTPTNNSFINITVKSPLATTNNSINRIMLMGDSITAGGAGGVVPLGAWGLLLPDLMGSTWSVANVGTSGETAGTGRIRFTEELDIYHPTHVVIMYGTNDLARGRSVQDVVNDITWMVNTAKSRGIVPYVLTCTASSGATNPQKIYLNENLTLLKICNVFNVYDAIDSMPQNGQYDAYDSMHYVDVDHPNNEGNVLLGNYISRNIIATSQLTGIGVNHTIYANGTIQNSRDIRTTDSTINAVMTPDVGSISVNVSDWTATRKVWNESSETHNAITQHIIGDLPANTPVQIKRDGANYEVMTSNSTGYIDWTYSGGYSEHTFEVTASSPITLTITSLNALKSSSEAATNMTLSAETQYTGTGALYNSVRDTISSGYTLASLIILVIGAYALFRYMGYF